MLRRWYDIDRDLAVANELRQRMEQLFGVSGDQGGPTRMTGSWPKASLYDLGSSVVAVLVVPGLIGDQLNVEVHQDTLSISGERKVIPPEGYRVHRTERGSGKFSRSFGLPCQVDSERTKAQLTDGLLTITMEKHPESQPRKITVSAG